MCFFGMMLQSNYLSMVYMIVNVLASFITNIQYLQHYHPPLFPLTSKQVFHVDAHPSVEAQKDNYIGCLCIHTRKPQGPTVLSHLFIHQIKVWVLLCQPTFHIYFLYVTHPSFVINK